MHTFDLANCVRAGDHAFAWDAWSKSIVRIELTSVSVKDVPEEVVKTLLAAANNTRKGDNV